MTTEDFEAQRAVFNDELTRLALAGADTARTRDKIAKLDQREQAAREAEQAAAYEARRQRELAAVSEAASICTRAGFRLSDAGFELTEADSKTLALLAHAIVQNDPALAEAEAIRDAALYEVERISERIALLNERAVALQNLRLTNQSSQRDLVEAATIERDLDTLRSALTDAESKADAAKVPAGLLEMRRRAVEALAAYEVHVVTRSLHERVHAAEQAYLEAVRNLLVGTGSRTTVGLYQRGAAFDRFVRLNVL